MGKYRTSIDERTTRCDPRGTSEWRRTKRHVILLVWALAYATIVAFGGSQGVVATPLVGSAEDLLIEPSDEEGSSGEFVSWEPLIGRDVDGKNCTTPSVEDFPADLFTRAQRVNGALAIHFIVSFYLFYALLLVCDDYFVPSIESICRELKIEPATAGATFMAISTSAPELFTNVIGTFVTKGDIGVGTIVGSAVFNILAVGACCGLGAGLAVNKIRGADGRVGVPLEWWPLTRDCLFYSLSVGILMWVLANRRVYWYEALSMVLFYVLYMIVMCNNTKVKSWADKLVDMCRRGERKRERLSVTMPRVRSKHLMTEKTPLIITQNGNEKPKALQNSNSSSSEHLFGVSPEILEAMLLTKAIVRSENHCIEEQETWGLCSFPCGKNWKICIEWIIGWPIRLIFTLTIPDCRTSRFRKWYPITLIMCIMWIAALTYVVSWMMSIIGDTLQIPDSVTGLTFLAAGTSIPEVISSIIVARQGLGSMGLSNSIGSNTFDLLVCLGFPWLIETLVLSSSEADYVQINSEGLEYSILLLVTSLMVFYVIIATNGFLLDAKVGVSSLVMYVIFITLACLLELNFFFPVNLPLCDAV